MSGKEDGLDERVGSRSFRRGRPDGKWVFVSLFTSTRVRSFPKMVSETVTVNANRKENNLLGQETRTLNYEAPGCTTLPEPSSRSSSMGRGSPLPAPTVDAWRTLSSSTVLPVSTRGRRPPRVSGIGWRRPSVGPVPRLVFSGA